MESKQNIKELISAIYECQKQIILKRREMRDSEDGMNYTACKNEIIELEKKILEFQRELKEHYKFNY